MTDRMQNAFLEKPVVQRRHPAPKLISNLLACKPTG